VEDVCITGVGLVTAVGSNANETIDAIQRGKTGIGIPQYVKSRYASVIPFGEVGLSDTQLIDELAIGEKVVSRTQLLAHKAFNEALANSGLHLDDFKNAETSIVLSSTVGGMYLTDELYADSNNLSKGSIYLSFYDCASIGIYLQQLTGAKGLINTINTACSSGANALIYGMRLLRNKRAKRVIVGGVDCLSKFTINGFNALNILSTKSCRPFDNNRDGLNLGEGAGFLILESSDLAKEENVIACISGFANSNDAFHPSSLSDEGFGPMAAMRGALEYAGLLPYEIDSVIAHGTGTPNNDKVEGLSIKKIFGESLPPVCSLKSILGHTLGAASAVESVLAVIGVKNGYIYPSRNFETPDKDTGLVPNLNFKKEKIKHCLLNSFGFGGNCSSLIFSSVN